MQKPVLLQMGPYPQWDQEPLDEAFDVIRYFEAEDKQTLLAERGAAVRAIATRGELGASRAIIEACPKLEIISIYGVGYDAVDLVAARERGIRVTNTPDVLTRDVADLAVGMALSFTRNMRGAEAHVLSGEWAKSGAFALQRQFSGLRAGILGLGRIGYEVAKRLAAFDMDIAYSARAPKPEAKDMRFVADAVSLARESDLLFVTLAATAETRHIVNAAVLEALGPQGVVINVSRAANIDEEALLDALENRRLGGAALDVFEGEPKINPRFLTLNNVLLQPHQGSGTVETRKAMGALVRKNLLAHFAGEALPTPVV